MTVMLESKGICKYFAGLKAVHNVDMTVQEGEVFGIIGPNGAGKTTFFNVCSGVLPATAGEIYLLGEKVTGLRPEQIARKGLGRTFQNIQLFKLMTVWENVRIGCHINTKTNVADAIFHTKTYREDEEKSTQKAMEVLAQLNLEKYADVMAGNLPYGVQRKVEIARMLAADQKVLLLDEPAAGMNPQETESLREFIRQLNHQGYTVIVIEHDMKFIMNLCDRIMVINFGEKLCEGTPAEVQNNEQVHEAYFGKRKLGLDTGKETWDHA